MLKNRLLLDAALGIKTERPPVWVMRQAGRILPEYRAVREKLKGFKELVENPELAAEVTVQPVDVLGVDAAIIFSDILVIPEAMGLPYQMIKGKGPWFEKTIQNTSDIEKLKIATAEDVYYTIKAIEIVKKELSGRVPLIGFAGAPWTIFSYMIEGSGSKTFSKARRFLYTNPDASKKLLEKIAFSTVNYLQGQINAGADIVQIFDSWAGVLTPSQYKEFAIPYIKMITDELHTDVPVIVFSKGAYFALRELSALHCHVIGLDWNMEIEKVREVTGNQKTLQGNLDPCLLYADDEKIVSETEKMLRSFINGKNIANLGHGVYPDTDYRKVKLFIDTIKNYRYEK